MVPDRIQPAGEGRLFGRRLMADRFEPRPDLGDGRCPIEPVGVAGDALLEEGICLLAPDRVEGDVHVLFCHVRSAAPCDPGPTDGPGMPYKVPPER